MGFMFNDNHKFNKNIGDWDVSNVTDMRLMFFCDIVRDGIANKSTFNQDISNWNVSNVKYCNSFSDYGSLEGKHKPNFSNCN
jgi:surface protein